jgi:hypothetical protein
VWHTPIGNQLYRYVWNRSETERLQTFSPAIANGGFFRPHDYLPFSTLTSRMIIAVPDLPLCLGVLKYF